MKTWLVGAGPMAQEYFKVLSDIGEPVNVVGRSELSSKKFTDLTKQPVLCGDIESVIESQGAPERAIVAVSVENLAAVATALLRAGTKRILLEKPGALNNEEINALNKLSKLQGADVFIAYNRRFYASTRMARNMIQEDGGVLDCHFEFTEWAHTITPLAILPEVKEHWFLANSSHVSDLAFHLCGTPKDWRSFHGGSLDWHSRAARFNGSGITHDDVCFNYFADWEAPGRWAVELLTRKRRLIFRPLEKLHVTHLASTNIELVEMDYSLDEKYKPGLYLQIKAFLAHDDSDFCTIEEQARNFEIYNKMAGYSL